MNIFDERQILKDALDFYAIGKLSDNSVIEIFDMVLNGSRNLTKEEYEYAKSLIPLLYKIRQD